MCACERERAREREFACRHGTRESDKRKVSRFFSLSFFRMTETNVRSTDPNLSCGFCKDADILAQQPRTVCRLLEYYMTCYWPHVTTSRYCRLCNDLLVRGQSFVGSAEALYSTTFSHGHSCKFNQRRSSRSYFNNRTTRLWAAAVA